MFLAHTFKTLIIAGLLGASFSMPVQGQEKQDKPNRAELEERLRKLELKAKIGQHVTFVSRGQLTFLGIDLPTEPPTQEEIEEIQQYEGN